mmetsp:Transcript_24162/g.62249  ORF Transcript_24162/g.62249 Transcript_24162/m.62249 type:complete len:299 (-) Transcript_24162:152-1048(-)
MVRFAICGNSTSEASGLPFACTLRISTRPAASGRSTGTRRSNRPGRVRAASSTSARLVAATTITPRLPSKPSISVRIWLSVCSRSSLPPMPWPEPARCRPIASISSMKMMHGAFFLACEKRSRTREAPTPTNISTNSEPDAEMNGVPASPATARASSVLPVPGGPYRSTPFGALIPTRSKSSGLTSGSSITSRSSRICSARPPTLEYETSPGSSLSMLNTTGSTSRGSARMIVSVVMSRATRVPFVSFALSTFDLQPTTYRGPLEALTMNFSSSSWRSTSPIIWPTLCSAFRSSSVLS